MNELDRKEKESMAVSGMGLVAAIGTILLGISKMAGKAAGDSTKKSMAEMEWDRVNSKSELWRCFHSGEVKRAKDNLKKYRD